MERRRPSYFRREHAARATEAGSIQQAEAFKPFFLSLGFEKIVVTTAENHDRMIAFTSQLAHVVSNAYVKSPEAEKHDATARAAIRI